MTWRCSKRPESSRKDRIATADEIRKVLTAEHDYLYWVSLFVTGDPALANKSLMDAVRLSTTEWGVFHDWLVRWARSATARVAAQNMHDAIIAAAPAYESHACEHADHEVLFEDKVGFIRRLDPLQVVAELDVFSRAVLVLRGVQGASISDCALLLEVPRKCVRGAYCRSLHWLYKKADVLRSLGDAGDPGLEILG